MASDLPAGSVGIVVGLAAEARIVRCLGWPVAVGGGEAAGAEAAARRLVAGGARGLLSFGLCGGLDPALKPGALLVPGTVLTDGVRYTANAGLAAPFGGLTPHVLLGAGRVAASAEAKRALRAATGAAGIDLESGAVARVATLAGRPFAVARAVCDAADQDLPPAALAALDTHGAIGLLRVAASVAAQPAQVSALVALARNAAAAHRRLASAVAAASRAVRRAEHAVAPLESRGPLRS